MGSKMVQRNTRPSRRSTIAKKSQLTALEEEPSEPESDKAVCIQKNFIGIPKSHSGRPLRSTFENQVEAVLGAVESLLEDYGCGDMVALEAVDTNTPFLRPQLPVRVAGEETYNANKLYKYIRKTRNYNEKIRIRVMNLTKKKEIGGLHLSGVLENYILFRVVLDLVHSTRTLTVLRLVDCGLKAEGIRILGKELGQTTITYLYLDRNHVEQQNYYCILENNQMLRHLSLVQCRIDVEGAKLLGRQLGPTEEDHPSHCLKSLNLNNNRLDCLAAKYLAQGLKWNRDLVFLALAGNKIGNIGIEFLCNAMQLSPLEKWEKEFMETRHQRRSEKIQKMLEEEIENYKMPQEYGEIGDDGDSGLNGKQNLETLLQEYMANDPNPISRDVVIVNGKLMSTGNKTLRFLDICYNKIETVGFQHFLNLLKYQLKERKKMTEEERERSHLTNIKVAGNFCSETSLIVRKIYHYIQEIINFETEVAPEWEANDEVEINELVDAIEEEVASEEEAAPKLLDKDDPREKLTSKDKKGRKGKKSGRLKGEASLIESEDKPPAGFESIIVLPSETESTDLSSIGSLIGLQKSSSELSRSAISITNAHDIVNKTDSE